MRREVSPHGGSAREILGLRAPQSMNFLGHEWSMDAIGSVFFFFFFFFFPSSSFCVCPSSCLLTCFFCQLCARLLLLLSNCATHLFSIQRFHGAVSSPGIHNLTDVAKWGSQLEHFFMFDGKLDRNATELVKKLKHSALFVQDNHELNRNVNDTADVSKEARLIVRLTRLAGFGCAELFTLLLVRRNTNLKKAHLKPNAARASLAPSSSLFLAALFIPPRRRRALPFG